VAGSQADKNIFIEAAQILKYRAYTKEWCGFKIIHF
jgi:hypothetical protein